MPQNTGTFFIWPLSSLRHLDIFARMAGTTRVRKYSNLS